MRRWLIATALGLLVGLTGIALSLSPLGAPLEQSVGLNWLFAVRGPAQPPQNVAIVAIDSRTGDQLDLPAQPRDWPRTVHGRLVDALVERGAAVIVFDVHFGRAKDADADRTFVDAVRRAGNVVLVELLTGKRQPITDTAGRDVGLVWAEELVPPFAELAASAAGLATFPLPKEGAAVYQFWSFKESANQAPTMPAVALQLYARDTARSLTGRARKLSPSDAENLPDPDMAFNDARELRRLMRGLRMIYRQADASFPADGSPPLTSQSTLEQSVAAMYAGDAHPYLNFYGPPHTIATVPYQSVIRGTDPNLAADAMDFRGKVVFVGYSDYYDPGQPDRFYTVYTRNDGVDLSGVEIAATAFANLATQRTLAPLGPWTAMLLVFSFGLLLGSLIYLLNAYIGVTLALLIAAAYMAVAQTLFNAHAIVVPVATPLLVLTPLALIVGLLGQYLLERRRGQRISEAIHNYLPDEVVRGLSENRLNPNQLNRVVYGTCLATDMAGFSSIAERMQPGELADFLNDYFETLATPLKRHGVHITEFRADAIMCAWTADSASAEPRRKALLAALDAFRQRHTNFGAQLRIGLEAGQVYVGHAGGGGRYVYSIVGDSANTASRVEGLNKHVGTQVLATGSVIEGFENLLTRYLGDFQFANKSESTPVYEVLCKLEHASEDQHRLCAAFANALDTYMAGEWEHAAFAFEQIIAERGEDGPSRFFAARCRRFMSDATPPENPRVIRMDMK